MTTVSRRGGCLWTLLTGCAVSLVGTAIYRFFSGSAESFSHDFAQNLVLFVFLVYSLGATVWVLLHPLMVLKFVLRFLVGWFALAAVANHQLQQQEFQREQLRALERYGRTPEPKDD